MSGQDGAVQPYAGDGQVVVPSKDWDDEERAYQANKLRNAGHDWKEIAELTGYASSVAAKVSVRTYLQRVALVMSAEHRQEALDLEMNRLEELIKAYWPTAMAGEVKHADFVLRVIGQQARMLGLEELASKTQSNTTKTIIVSSNSLEYVEQLKQIAETATIPVANRIGRAGEDDDE